MQILEQGDIVRLEQPAVNVLVLSREFFNRTGMAVVCPVAVSASGDALHVPVTAGKIRGVAMLEQLKSMDLRARHYQKLSALSYDQIQNISDAVQGIFEYYPLTMV